MIGKAPKWYVESWLGGFDWAKIVGVDACAQVRRAGNVGGRLGVVYVEQCVVWLLSRYLVVGLRKRCAGVVRVNGGWMRVAGSC